MGLADNRARADRSVAVAPSARGARVAQAFSDALIVAVSAGIAGAAAYAIWRALPEQLDVDTDIVGYPTFRNFNINRYYWVYWLAVGFVPLVTVALFVVLRRLVPRSEALRRPRPREPALPRPVPTPTGGKLVAVGLSRVVFVGLVLGLEIAVAVSHGNTWFHAVGLPVAAAFTGLACAAAYLLERVIRRPSTFWDRLALVNALAVPFCIAALYAVSRSTEVTVVSTDRVREYSWFPVWLAAALTVGLLAWAGWRALAASAGAEFQRLERRLLLTVAGPVAIFLFVAALPGAGGPIEMFHEGELLAAARLVEDGAFPWRDFIFIHGLFFDVGVPTIGFNTFEESRWGWNAGTSVILTPLYWIFLYYLYTYLFHRNWLFLLGTQLTLVLGVIFEGHLRFWLFPLVLLLFAALLTKPSAGRAAALMGALVVQTILTPEAGIVAFACLAVLVGFEAYYYDRQKPFRLNFRRAVLCTGYGAIFTIVWFSFLAAFGALDDFVFAYLTFSSDHQLTGGVPVNWVSDRYRWAAIAPAVLVVLAIWFFALQILRRGELTVADWTMAAGALVVGIYHHKFLARADEHVYQSYGVAVPLLLYVVYRLISVTEGGVRGIAAGLRLRVPVQYPVTAVAVAVLLVQAPASASEVLRSVTGRLDAEVDAEVRTPDVGYTSPEGVHVDLLRGLDAIFDAYLRPNEAVFDFSNSPALIHYLLDRPSATRYYHVSMAIRRETQEDLVEELERERPRLVVFSSGLTGLGVWDDISNQVRHYEVSRYLLDRYRPLLYWNGFVFLWREGVDVPSAPRLAGRLGEPLDRRDLYFRTWPCDWGYAPNFLAAGPEGAAATRPLRLQTRELGGLATVTGWAVDPKAGTVEKVVAAINGKVVAQETPSIVRGDVAERFNDEKFLGSGFSMGVPLRSARRSELESVRIYGLTHSGEATELHYTSGSTWGVGRGAGPRTLLIDGRRVRVAAGAAEGFVDTSSLSDQLLALDVPHSDVGGRYNWLEIQTRAPLRENGFVITDVPTDVSRAVFFRTLDRDRRSVRIPVGACSQWHGYGSRRLYLRVDRRQAIAAVRLYR